MLPWVGYALNMSHCLSLEFLKTVACFAQDGENARIPRSRLIDLLRNSVKPGRVNRIEEVLLGRTARVTMLLENLTDPANASACIRTCEGLGLNEMHVIESYEPFRSSMVR